MIRCEKCKRDNPPEAFNCENCGSALLYGPTLGARAKSGLIFIIGAVISIILYFVLFKKNPTMQCLCVGFTILLTLFYVIFLIAKTPQNNFYKYRAIRHLTIDSDQARSDFIKFIELTEPKKRLLAIKEVYKDFLKIDSDLVERLIVNEIRVRPQRSNLRNAFSVEMQWLLEQVKSEADQAALSRDMKEATRKHLYAYYLMEAYAFIITLPSTPMGAREGWKMSGEVHEEIIRKKETMRDKALNTGLTMKLIICQLCSEIISDPDAHNLNHKNQIYDVIFMPDEEKEVRQALELYLHPEIWNNAQHTQKETQGD